MHRKLSSHKGFTLVELMVVVAIIGILAVSGVVVFTGHFDKVRMSNARMNLQDLKVAEEMYYSLYDTYAPDITDGTFNAMLNFDYTDTTYYKIYIKAADNDEFSACAVGAKDGDIWNIKDDTSESTEVSSCPGITP